MVVEHVNKGGGRVVAHKVEEREVSALKDEEGEEGLLSKRQTSREGARGARGRGREPLREEGVDDSRCL